MSEAYQIPGEARIAATWRASKTTRHIWARRSDGHLVRLTLDSDTDDEAQWADQMWWGGAPPNVHTRGVDGVSWTNAAGQEEEHVAYIGVDNRIYDWRLVNGVSLGGSYISIQAPNGESLTGSIAVWRRVDHVFFAVTTQLGRLYFIEVTNWNVQAPEWIWNETTPVLSVNTDAMIAATGPSPSGAYVRVFFSKMNNTVWQYKYDGAIWTNVSFPGPGTQAAPCALSAAAEGNLGTAGYRTYLFCTRTGGTPDNVRLYYKWSTGSGGTNFNGWSWKSVPAGGVATSGFGLTARRRAEGGANTLEAFLLGSVVTNKLFHLEHTANAANIQNNIGNLGWDGETTARRGGIVAAGAETRGYSDAYFVGQAHFGSWLYRKIDDDNGDGFAAEWVNYGASDGWKAYYVGSGTPSPTEAATSILGGKVAFFATFSDPNATATTWLLWSTDEGEHFGPPQQIPNPPSGPGWLPPGATWRVNGFDPVVDFDDSGRAYLIELRTTLMADGVTSGGRGVVVWSTANGSQFDFHGVLFGNQVATADHPWVAVYRNPDGVDELHVVWVIQGGNPFYYSHAPLDDLPSLANTLQGNIVAVDTGAGVTAIPKLTVSNFDGTVNLVWPHGICRVVPTTGDCDGLLLFGDDYTPDSADSVSGSELQFPGTSNTFRATRNFGIVADPENPNVVFYAFQKREPGVAEGSGPFDIYVTKLQYWFGAIEPGPRILLNIEADDEIHQTMPELTVSQDGPEDRMFFATWYDWNNVSCTINGVVYDGNSGATDRCYQVYMARSTDLGLSWQTIPHVFPTVSDPALLPRRTLSAPATQRFLGDYHSVTGDILHSAHVAITSPVGGTDQVTNVERGWVSHGYWNNTD